MNEFGKVVLGCRGAWLAVNLPVMLSAFHGWAYFYTFSRSRGGVVGLALAGPERHGASRSPPAT